MLGLCQGRRYGVPRLAGADLGSLIGGLGCRRRHDRQALSTYVVTDGDTCVHTAINLLWIREAGSKMALSMVSATKLDVRAFPKGVVKLLRPLRNRLVLFVHSYEEATSSSSEETIILI